MQSQSQWMTVDESMVICKGKYCAVKQYMPNKLIRFGLKYGEWPMPFQTICEILKFIVEKVVIHMIVKQHPMEKVEEKAHPKKREYKVEKVKDYNAKRQ